ncbi:Glycoside hydrolase family 81 protein [Mycena venus]|uniref:Glycoside hydrolase family 81 protein n=1 Tax=Mycena venus TaxID=2733690 RepID=A0A8H7CSF7_9AGAR|nr:Glycoside hydrolase family 81 protein [Mycena venus]
MRFAKSTLFSFICAGLGLVHATDDRLLFAIPAGDTIATFTTAFQTTCRNWSPAVEAGLKFEEALVEPGDFSGENATTEAKILCYFTDGTTFPEFTSDVAESLGATPVA